MYIEIDFLVIFGEILNYDLLELKYDRNFSVIDQGYAYLSLLLNNKGEFILKFNENKKGFLKKDDVDWNDTCSHIMTI